MSSRLVVILAGIALALCFTTSGALWYARVKAREATMYAMQARDYSDQVRDLRAVQARLQTELARQKQARKPAVEAINANPTWRDAAVPAAVADGLCQRLKCAEVHPVSTPSR